MSQQLITFLVRLPEKWFIIGLFLIPFIAWIWPQGGVHSASDFVNAACIAIIFLLNGMTIRKKTLFLTIRKVRLHTYIQLGCFLLFPVSVRALDRLLIRPFDLLQPAMVHGLFIMSCLPITTSSCVVLTKIAHGDEHSALFNAVLSNFLGIIIAPFALKHFLFPQEHALTLYPWTIIAQLSLFTLFPTLIGYLICRGTKDGEHCFGKKIFVIGEVLLLYIIYAAFCLTYLRSHKLISPVKQMTILILFLILFHFFILAATYYLGRWGHFSKTERKTMLFTIPQKTVALGIPLIVVVVSSSTTILPSDSGLYFLPLLIYNNIQMLVAGPLAYVAKTRQ